MPIYGFKEEDIARISAAIRAYEQSEGSRPSRQTIATRQPIDPMRLVRATEAVAGGSSGMFQFITGSKGSETDTTEEPLEMWSPPGMNWEEDDKGYALYIDTGWEVARRSCT